MSPPAVVTESADVQPEQPAASSAIAEELEKKLQVRTILHFLFFFCHGLLFFGLLNFMLGDVSQTDEPIVEDDEDDDDDEEEEDDDAQGDSSFFFSNFSFP